MFEDTFSSFYGADNPFRDRLTFDPETYAVIRNPETVAAEAELDALVGSWLPSTTSGLDTIITSSDPLSTAANTPGENSFGFGDTGVYVCQSVKFEHVARL